MTACPVCRARVRARADGTAGAHEAQHDSWTLCMGVGRPVIDLPTQVGGRREGAGRPPVGAQSRSVRVVVLLTPSEAGALDSIRGQVARGEWLAIKANLRAVPKNL